MPAESRMLLKRKASGMSRYRRRTMKRRFSYSDSVIATPSQMYMNCNSYQSKTLLIREILEPTLNGATRRFGPFWRLSIQQNFYLTVGLLPRHNYFVDRCASRPREAFLF